MAATGGAKTIITAFIANFCIAIAKLFGFFITSSSAMLAESIHSFADTSNQALLLLGRKRSKKLPEHDDDFAQLIKCTKLLLFIFFCFFEYFFLIQNV